MMQIWFDISFILINQKFHNIKVLVMRSAKCRAHSLWKLHASMQAWWCQSLRFETNNAFARISKEDPDLALQIMKSYSLCDQFMSVLVHISRRFHWVIWPRSCGITLVCILSFCSNYFDRSSKCDCNYQTFVDSMWNFWIKDNSRVVITSLELAHIHSFRFDRRSTDLPVEWKHTISGGICDTVFSVITGISIFYSCIGVTV